MQSQRSRERRAVCRLSLDYGASRQALRVSVVFAVVCLYQVGYGKSGRRRDNSCRGVVSKVNYGSICCGLAERYVVLCSGSSRPKEN